jgi:ubiquinone/menaquinone biosynthesis C-methylase UbiE
VLNSRSGCEWGGFAHVVFTAHVQTDNSYSPDVVRNLFDEMAATYGVVNLISSFGFCAVWRHQVTRGLPLESATRVVDLMSGMNELCRSLAPRSPSDLSLTSVDFSPEMVRRARKDWPFDVSSRLEDVFSWKFEPGSADIVISSFGLKTLDRHQQMQLSKVVDELLRPGGVFSFVEISVPRFRMLRFFYMFYLNRMIPWIGRLFLGNPANYRMLGLYTRQFGDCRYFAECLRRHGIEVAEVSYFFGCATGVRGTKPIGTPDMKT